MRVLIADDQPLDRSMLKIALDRWGYDVVECSDGEQALDVLRHEDAPQLAILDWMMPGKSGPEICADVRFHTPDRYTYILLLTSKDESGDVVEGMQSGADDYLVKPVDMHELRARLRAGQRIIRLESDLIEAREKLKIQATHDPLTGLANRAAILEIVDREFARAMREGHHLSLIMGDLDHFKEVNDTYGHQTGDAVLREASNRLLTAVRTFDAVGRYGGEEFLIVAMNCDSIQAKKVAERICMTMAEQPICSHSITINVTISLGVVSLPAAEGLDPLQFIRAADRALYQAKSAGRNRVEVATDSALKSV